MPSQSFLASLTLLLAAGVAFAADQPHENPRLAESTVRILDDACRYVTEAGSFTVRARIEFDEVLPTGQKLQYSGTADIAVRRPNRLRVDYRGDLRATTVWYDGESLTLMDRAKMLYSTAAAPATIDEAVDFAMDRHGFTVPVAGRSRLPSLHGSRAGGRRAGPIGHSVRRARRARGPLAPRRVRHLLVPDR